STPASTHFLDTPILPASFETDKTDSLHTPTASSAAQPAALISVRSGEGRFAPEDCQEAGPFFPVSFTRPNVLGVTSLPIDLSCLHTYTAHTDTRESIALEQIVFPLFGSEHFCGFIRNLTSVSQ
ncbi:MAG: hypothetical protein RL768_2872, partial [Nitrospirota bacterium]